jgi:hypothetical protein
VPSLSPMAAPGTWPVGGGKHVAGVAARHGAAEQPDRAFAMPLAHLPELLQGLLLLRALPARCAPYSLTRWGLGC